MSTNTEETERLLKEILEQLQSLKRLLAESEKHKALETGEKLPITLPPP